MHFEELWENAESIASNNSTQSVLEELELKIKLYKAIHSKELPEEQIKNLKLKTIGEILLTITNLSANDKLDVFEALNTALTFRKIEKSI